MIKVKPLQWEEHSSPKIKEWHTASVGELILFGIVREGVWYIIEVNYCYIGVRHRSLKTAKARCQRMFDSMVKDMVE